MAERAGEPIDLEVTVAKASYTRCRAEPDFFAAFYRNFFAACPRAAPLFAQTDFARQHKLLRHAFALLLLYPGQRASEPDLLTRIAERHSRRDLDIDPALYGPFVDSLIVTVRQHDPEFAPAVERAWRRTVAVGVAFMQARY
jgi:hemoglobin-like flavoprotein